MNDQNNFYFQFCTSNWKRMSGETGIASGGEMSISYPGLCISKYRALNEQYTPVYTIPTN